MRILFIAMANSVHTARWVDQLADQGWDLHLFPSTDSWIEAHPAMRNVTLHHTGFRNPAQSPNGVRFRGVSLARRVQDVWRRRVRKEEGDDLRVGHRADRLAGLIARLRPDVVHSMEIQHAGYLTLEARRRPGRPFPPWVDTNWGSDIYLFGRLADHAPKIREVLAGCDYYSCECLRDVSLAKSFGFAGTVLPVFPNAGGFDLAEVARLRQPGPASARRAIMLNSCSAYDKCLGFGASAERVRLVRYPGVDRERFRPMARDEARRALGISAGKVILCPRGLGGYLNSDVIVEAAAGVAREWPDALFLFVSGVGGEAERENHRQMARSLGIEKKCRFDGQVPWEAMPTYYGASDAMVSISSNDSLPNCMMEAMACGVPVIMGDIPQLREWVDDGINGFLVPPMEPRALAERILRVVRDEDGSVAAFSSRNIDLVAREFDGARNAREVKDLVGRVAGRAP